MTIEVKGKLESWKNLGNTKEDISFRYYENGKQISEMRGNTAIVVEEINKLYLLDLCEDDIEHHIPFNISNKRQIGYIDLNLIKNLDELKPHLIYQKKKDMPVTLPDF